MGHAVTDEDGIPANFRGTALLCASGTLVVRGSLIMQGTACVTK